MSHEISDDTDERPTSAPEGSSDRSGSDAGLRGPVEPLDGHEDNEHLALLYEDQDEQFATAIPFVQEGLERGERCVYIAHDNTTEELLDALRARGVDVDAALQSDALSVLTPAESYRRSGEFDREEMEAFWTDALADATDDGFTGLRAAAEMTWALESDTDLEDLCEYEELLNPLYDGDEYTTLCQYNRDRFPAEVVNDVLETHPYVAHEGTVCRNVYYTPPEEYFGPDDRSREVDRKLETLTDRTDAQLAIERRERYQRRIYEIVSDAESGFEEKLDALLALGCERFGLDVGALARIDPEEDRWEVETVHGDHDQLAPGAEFALSETYCRAVADSDTCPDATVPEPVEITDPVESGYENTACFSEFGVESYLGARIPVDGDDDRTFFFAAEEPRDAPVPEEKLVFHQLMGQWVRYELERQQRERELQERTEHLDALVETTPECIKQVAPDGALLQMNAAGLEMVGTDDRSEVVGESVYDLIVPEHRERFREFNEAVCQGERGTLEFDLVGLDGTRRHMKSHAAPLERPDGQTIHVALTHDITEQVERERELDETIAKLEESQERLQLALKAGEMGFWELDLQTGTAPVHSPQHDRIFGYAGLLDEWDFGTFLDHVHPDDRDRVVHSFADAFETGKWEFECRIVDADGDQRAITAHGDFYDDSEGDPDRAVGVVQDVTERKERERELERVERQFEAAFNNPNTFIGLLDPDGTVRRVNDTALKFAGIDEANVQGGKFWETPWFAHSEQARSKVRGGVERAADGEYVRAEIEHHSPEGETAIVDAMLEPVYDEDGDVVSVMPSGRNITERKEREEELRQTKNRFETVFEQSDDSIFIIDPESDELVDANPAAAEMTGYSSEELLTQRPSDLHADEMERFRAFLDEVRETGTEWSEDFYCRHRDGRKVPAEITASAITLDGRELVLALVRDITERKEHERYQRDLYEITASPDLGFDEKLEQLLELGRERFGLEMAGLNHLPSWDGAFRLEKGIGLDVDPDEELWTDPDNGCYCRQTVTEDEPVAVADVRETDWTESSIYRRFGIASYLGTKVSAGSMPYGTLWFGSTEPRGKPFSDAERSFIELMGQWVSYEIERSEQNGSQRKLYEIAADPGLSTDEKIDRLLEVGCDYLDLSIGILTRERAEAFEIVQMYGSHFKLEEGTVSPPLTDNYCQRVVDTGSTISVADTEAAGWDEDALYQEFDLRCYAGTQVTADDESYGTVCFTDTAPRGEFTEAERTFLDLLGQSIGYELERKEYERELKETVGRLQQSNERLEQFAYAASHDLQEPLRMVTSYLQLLESRYSDAFDEDGQEFLEFAIDGADRMRGMIEGLLEYSRVETRGESFEPVRLDAVLADVREDLQLQIEDAGAEISTAELPQVAGDASQLRQLFQNLLDNALTYSGDEPPRIHVDAERRGGEWVISVQDNGIGIDPDDQDRVFTVFDRLHSRDEYAGTGLGLALCQRIVERHGGEIWVDSEPGDGATFSFTVPTSEE